VHRLGLQQREEFLLLKEPPQRIDDKTQPGLRQVGFLDQQLLTLRLGLVAPDQRRRGDLSGVRRAAAAVRLLAALARLKTLLPMYFPLVSTW
jgi:hypothetical protein